MSEGHCEDRFQNDDMIPDEFLLNGYEIARRLVLDRCPERLAAKLVDYFITTAYNTDKFVYEGPDA